MTTKEIARDRRCRTNEWGIDLAFEDALGKWHETPKKTEQAILAAMGVDPHDTPKQDEDDPVIVVRTGEARSVPAPGRLILESGERRKIGKELPADLTLGYHQLQFENSSRTVPVIVAPKRCWLPADLKTWGWSVQLYATRSRESWGMGDFRDLKQLAAWSVGQGAGMMLLNPLGASTPIRPVQGSPYYPASRLFSSPLWLHIPALPGAQELGPEYDALKKEAVALNSERLIERDKIFSLKIAALEMLWRKFRGDAGFDAFCSERGEALDGFAAFCALAEQHRSGWHNWPSELQHPHSPAVRRFAEANSDRVRFHKWLQWLLDKQLSESAGLLALMQDLPIGVDPDGADAWAWQDVFARGIGVGAPPDEFNTQGQDWGLPPFVPHKLRAAAYRPLVETIRAAFRHCGGLRIDHVMGLFRLFWVPNGMKPADGAYVRYNEDEMLSIVALESERARAYVVGEDLGTVEDGAREKLASFNVLSYRLLWFEKDLPATYPLDALAAVTTHDLPTVAGLWTGSDLEKQRELGLQPNDDSTAEIRNRLAKTAKLNGNSMLHEVIDGAYRILAAAPSRIVTACLDDALAVEERPNIPSTNQDQNPNWSIALPAPIEEIISSELADKIAASLHSRA